MSKRKITVNKKAKNWQDRYPMISCTWLDILSDSSWQSIDQLLKSNLATCVTKGHLLSQAKGVTRIFGDYSANEKGEIEEIGNISSETTQCMILNNLLIYSTHNLFSDAYIKLPNTSKNCLDVNKKKQDEKYQKAKQSQSS